MNYFILNINYNGKPEVDYWLDEQKLAPIFYGKYTLDQIRNNKEHALTRLQYRDAKLFVDTFDNVKNDSIIFSIGNEHVYIYKQDDKLREFTEYRKPDNDLVKGFKIKLVKKVKIKDCPLILVSIKSNKYIATGTFKSLAHNRYIGNTNALDYLVGCKPVKISSFTEYLKCLSSVEFETLIAKYLEESGLFVTAYSGGCMRNYDLFCRNVTNETIKADKITVDPNQRISIQIKLHLTRHAYQDCVDHFFCISSDLLENNVHDHKYLQKNIERTPVTKKWLENSLDWVNANYNFM